MKYFFIIILIAVASYISWSIYYSNTDDGQFSIFLKNSVEQIEHIAKQRDIGATKDEAIAWFDSENWKTDLKVLRECILEGIDFVFSNPEIKPKNIAYAYKDKILANKLMWTNKIAEVDK